MHYLLLLETYRKIILFIILLCFYSIIIVCKIYNLQYYFPCEYHWTYYMSNSWVVLRFESRHCGCISDFSVNTLAFHLWLWIFLFLKTCLGIWILIEYIMHLFAWIFTLLWQFDPLGNCSIFHKNGKIIKAKKQFSESALVKTVLDIKIANQKKLWKPLYCWGAVYLC